MGCVKKTCGPVVSPGALKTPVTVQRQVLSPDGKGGQVKSWLPVGVGYFEVKQLNGREVFVDDQLRGEADHVFVTRWTTAVAFGIMITDRFLIANDITPAAPHVFNVRSIENVDYAGTVARILAERGVPT